MVYLSAGRTTPHYGCVRLVNDTNYNEIDVLDVNGVRFVRATRECTVLDMTLATHLAGIFIICMMLAFLVGVWVAH